MENNQNSKLPEVREQPVVVIKNETANNKTIIILALALAIVAIIVLGVRGIVNNAVRRKTAEYVTQLSDARSSEEELKDKIKELETQVKKMTEAGIAVETIREQVREIAKLELVEHDYTAVIVYTKDNKLFNKISVPFTGNRFVATIDGKVIFGVDVSQIDITAEENIVTVKCPHASVISSYALSDTLKVFDEKKNVFNKLDPKGYNDLIVQVVKDEETKAINNNLDRQADDRLKFLIVNHIKALCGDGVKVIVDYK